MDARVLQPTMVNTSCSNLCSLTKWSRVQILVGPEYPFCVRSRSLRKTCHYFQLAIRVIFQVIFSGGFRVTFQVIQKGVILESKNGVLL